MLMRVLLRNLPRWNHIRPWAPLFSRGFQGPTVKSNSAMTRSARIPLGTGMRRTFFGFSLVALWYVPGWVKVTVALDAAFSNREASAASDGVANETWRSPSTPTA